MIPRKVGSEKRLENHSRSSDRFVVLFTSVVKASCYVKKYLAALKLTERYRCIALEFSHRVFFDNSATTP